MERRAVSRLLDGTWFLSEEIKLPRESHPLFGVTWRSDLFILVLKLSEAHTDTRSNILAITEEISSRLSQLNPPLCAAYVRVLLLRTRCSDCVASILDHCSPRLSTQRTLISSLLAFSFSVSYSCLRTPLHARQYKNNQDLSSQNNARLRRGFRLKRTNTVVIVVSVDGKDRHVEALDPKRYNELIEFYQHAKLERDKSMSYGDKV